MTENHVLMIVVAYFAIGFILLFVSGESRASETGTAGRVVGDVAFWPLALVRMVARGRGRATEPKGKTLGGVERRDD